MDKFKKLVSFDDATISTIDDLRADFKDGFGLIRLLNTTPILVLRFEASTQEVLTRIQAMFAKSIHKVDPELLLPF